MAARRTAREESWNSVHHSDASDDLTSNPDEDGQADDSQLLTVGDVHRVLHPLQETADRVGKEVERFAETLDRLGKIRDSGTSDCRDVLPLVYEYEKIASDTVKRLKRWHEPERQRQLRRAWKKDLEKSGTVSRLPEREEDEFETELSTTVEDLNRWETERQTWQLLRLMLQLEYPVEGVADEFPHLEEQFKRPSGTPKVHQFFSEGDVWKSFLEQDSDMWEKYVVVEWLKSSADSSGQDIESMVEQIEAGADRGSGLSAPSWIHTKEAIKSQKRLRSWPQPLDPASPGIEASLVTTGNDKKSLVTQLDPDAFTRQGRRLESEDVFLERAIWVACYEMIRRGHSWTSIRNWCQERVEVWRALSMRGDPRLASEANSTKDVLSGWQARTIWRKMCATAARDGGIDRYENAVYGILSGDFSSVEKVVRNWDDYLFVLYNTQLLQGFDHYTRRTFAKSLPWEVLDKFGKSKFGDGVTRPAMTGAEALRELQEKDTIKEEAQSPIKALQGNIIAKNCRAYLEEQGRLINELRWRQDGGTGANHDVSTANLGVEDHDLLRILTHIALVFQALDKMPPSDIGAVANIIVTYVDFLGEAGKQQLLPLYASCLSPMTATLCMARQLPKIVESNERKQVMSLMEQNGLDVPEILMKNLRLIATSDRAKQISLGSVPPTRVLTVPHRRGYLTQIQAGIFDEEPTDEEFDLVNGMEWFLELDGHWDETINAGVYVYKYLLGTGALSAARELGRRIPLTTLAATKGKKILGRSIELGFSMEEEMEGSAEQRGTEISSHRRSKSQVEREDKTEKYLRATSVSYGDLEMLVRALDALDNWRIASDNLRGQMDPRHAKEIKTDLQSAFEIVQGFTDTILDEPWLLRPTNEAESVAFKRLRKQYLPELLIAYNTVLSVTGQFLSRENLLKSMDLAYSVAFNNEVLLQCFVEAERVSELVDGLAISGKTILRADEVGIKSGKRGRRGHQNEGRIGIWTANRDQILRDMDQANGTNRVVST